MLIALGGSTILPLSSMSKKRPGMMVWTCCRQTHSSESYQEWRRSSAPALSDTTQRRIWLWFSSSRMIGYFSMKSPPQVGQIVPGIGDQRKIGLNLSGVGVDLKTKGTHEVTGEVHSHGGIIPEADVVFSGKEGYVGGFFGIIDAGGDPVMCHIDEELKAPEKLYLGLVVIIQGILVKLIKALAGCNDEELALGDALIVVSTSNKAVGVVIGQLKKVGQAPCGAPGIVEDDALLSGIVIKGIFTAGTDVGSKALLSCHFFSKSGLASAASACSFVAS